MGKGDLLYGLYERRLVRQLHGAPVPRHVGVILDGNRRWARSVGATEQHGHDRGADLIDDLLGYARELELDVEQFSSDLNDRIGAARIAQDVESADMSGVSGTPTFFVNGERHHGAYDIVTLSAAVRAAGARAVLASAPSG